MRPLLICQVAPALARVTAVVGVSELATLEMKVLALLLIVRADVDMALFVCRMPPLTVVVPV